MRFRIDHPVEGTGYYGYDIALGWWAEKVPVKGAIRCYDRLTPNCGYQEAGCAVLEGLLHWIPLRAKRCSWR